MNRYEYRLQTIQEAITILSHKEGYENVIQQLQNERTQILDDMKVLE